MHSTPLTTPTPVIIPPVFVQISIKAVRWHTRFSSRMHVPAATSSWLYISNPANWDSSKNEVPESRSWSILSLGSSLFLSKCLARAFSPPPSLMASTFALKSFTRDSWDLAFSYDFPHRFVRILCFDCEDVPWKARNQHRWNWQSLVHSCCSTSSSIFWC